MDRREFVASSAAAVALASAARTQRPPHLRFPARAHERLAVSSYPFRFQMVASTNNRRDPKLPGMTVLQFAEFVKEEYGLAAIEVLDKHFEASDEASLRSLRAGLERRGVRLVNIPFDNKAQLCNDSAQDHDDGMALHRRWIENAVLLGCPSVRMRMPVGADPKVVSLACAVRSLKELASYAADRGVVLNIENDSPFTESAAVLTNVVAKVGNPWFRVLPDFANGLAAGDAAFNLQEMKQLFPLAFNIAHAKSWESIGGARREIRIAEVVRVAQQAGFKGWYSLESDSRDDPKEDTHALLDAMMHCLA